MATFTLQGGNAFPDGTTVSIYQRSVDDLSGVPSGTPVTSGTITGGSVLLTVPDDADFVAYAQVNGQDHYKRFSTQAPVLPSAGAGSLTADPAGGIPDWQPLTFFDVNVVRKFGGDTYVNLVAHESTIAFSGDDDVYWQQLSVSFANLDDVVAVSPADGDNVVYEASSGKWRTKRPRWGSATGPGGVAGAAGGAAVSLPDPLGASGYGLYHLQLTADCTVTMPSPAAVGSRLVLRATQDTPGGHALAFAASPAVSFPGVGLLLNTAANAENWIAFECGLDGAGNPTWYGFPATSSATNLSDVADPDAARLNLKVPVLRSAVRIAQTNIATLSGLPTVDGHVFVAGERILLAAQTTGSQNGPWIVHAGVWSRPTDYPSGATFRSRLIPVDGGTYANSLWSFSSDTLLTVDTDATTWVQIGASGGGSGVDTSGMYVPLVRASGRGSTSAVSGTNYMLGGTNADFATVASGTAQASAMSPVPLAAADYAVTGKTTKLRIKATVACAGAVSQNVTVGLMPVTYGASISAGAAVTGSTVTITPSANSGVSGLTADFAVPADGDYILGYTVAGVPASGFQVYATLQMHHG